MSFFGLNAGKTFKPKKNVPEGSKQAHLKRFADATLGTGNLRNAVILPEGEDLNEWLAVNTVDFFNQLNLLYGSITEYCTPQSCPVMGAGPKYEYHWCDGVQFKKPVKVSAPEYVDYLMTWGNHQRESFHLGTAHNPICECLVQSQLDDDNIFPTKIGVSFPKTFSGTIKTIFKRLFRVYAHMYFSHFERFVALQAEAHLNTSFKHFIFFANEFHLVEKKELAPLDDLISALSK